MVVIGIIPTVCEGIMRFFTGMLLSLLVLSGCAACNISKNKGPIYSYKCLPFSGNAALATGQATVSKQQELSVPVPQNPQAELMQAWRVGAEAHLTSRLNEVGKLGYRYVGIGMLDPAFNSIWLCFERRIK